MQNIQQRPRKRNVGSRTMAWFRFYSEVLEDPKVQRLPPHLFKAWVNLLCLANSTGGVLPSADDIAFKLRLSVQDAEGFVSDLILAGLIDITPNGLIPHNWMKRQFISDCSTERVRKHRENKAETDGNVSSAVTVTPPDSDTDSDTDTEKKDLAHKPSDETPVAAKPKAVRAATPRADARKGTRLALDWELPVEWRQWTQATCLAATAGDIEREAMKFANHWHSSNGRNAAKLDWFKTWQNWCLTAFSRGPIRPSQSVIAAAKVKFDEPDWMREAREAIQ